MKIRNILLACGVVSGFGGAGLGAALAMGATNPSVEEALAERLPNTQIDAVDCDEISALCAVQAGTNLFYVDRSARFLVVGRVYDMETRQDLTAARLLQMNPDMLLGSAAAAQPKTPDGDGSAPPSRTVDPAKLAALPENGAIVHGSGTTRITVFSDFRCGYCRQLADELAQMDVEVVERPISIMGTRALSESVVCASNPSRALRDAYKGGSSGGSTEDCDTSGLDANEAFARANGFNGTPVIVRDDGEVLTGYRPKATLEAWLSEGES